MAQNGSVRKSRPNILVTGTPGTGKTTTSSALAEATQFCHTSSEIWLRRRTSMTTGTTSLTVTSSMKASYSHKTLFLIILFSIYAVNAYMAVGFSYWRKKNIWYRRHNLDQKLVQCGEFGLCFTWTMDKTELICWNWGQLKRIVLCLLYAERFGK